MFKQLGKYELQQPLGSGAYADVYKAVDATLKRVVALKVLKPALLADEDAFRRFIQEAQAAANLMHPHIAWVWDLGEADGRYFIAMRFVEGPSLGKLLKERGALPWVEAWPIARATAQALQFAHERGLVHRDVKPQNIIVSPSEGAVLTDFGLVKAMEASGMSTRSGALIGTPQYIPPEVWKGQPVTAASDQYALACVLAEMLTGVGLFDAPTPPAVMLKHFQPTEFPPSWPVGVPENLTGVLTQALAQEPAQRFGGVNDLLQQLDSASRKQPEAVADHSESGQLKAALAAAIQIGEWEEAERLVGALDAAAPDDAVVRVYRLRVEREMAPIRARRAAEEQARREAAERARREAEKKAEREAAEKTRLEAEAENKRQRGELSVELAPGVSMEFVRVPAGEFWMGSNKKTDPNAYDDENPQHKIHLPEYLIGKDPVTNAQYAAFVKAAGYRAPVHWRRGIIPAGKEKHPVVMVRWQDANAFCQWASKVSGEQIRLPNEAEWEKAARGSDGRIYPWGSTPPDKTRCNFGGLFDGTTPVGQFSPASDSPYGCVDMAGNVWEWTSSPYKNYPYKASDGRESPGSHLEGWVLRGGSWFNIAKNIRAAFRVWEPASKDSDSSGFRCAITPANQTK